jgi:hypothetical protein
MLYPFFGTQDLTSDDPDYGRFDEYMANASTLFELSSKEEADLFVLPFDFSFDESLKDIIEGFLDEARQFRKKTLIFYNSDDDRPIILQDAIIFRTSFYLSQRSQNEYAFPGWSIDFLRRYAGGKLVPHGFDVAPSVGYCGYVDFIDKSWKERLKQFMGRTKSHPWEKLRGKAVRNILTDQRVHAEVVIRNGFWASGIEDKLSARQEYADNMIASDYVICCRGGGNFSYRQYEAMSLGRIPVFINTDSVLPWMREIPWNKIMVWVESTDVDQVSQKILAFHGEHQHDFESLQSQIRSWYDSHLSPLGFFTQLCLKWREL